MAWTLAWEQRAGRAVHSRGGRREREKRRKEKRKWKKKREKKEKEGERRKRKREGAGFAAPTAAGRARTPVARDARDEGQ